MLAQRLPGFLPPLEFAEALEVTQIHGAAGQLSPESPIARTRPFRAPHHTTSSAGLLGGGNPPGPGEVSLAHHGVLFLDELTEFVLPDAEHTTAWWIPARGWNRYEYTYKTTALSEVDRVHTPFTRRRASGTQRSIHEAALMD